MRARSGHLLAAMAALAIAGCAHYAPQPLDTAPPATELGGSVARPYLTPVTIDLARPLDGNAIATIAVIANPDLKALRARAQIADAQAFSAGLLPDPTFSAEGDALLSGPDSLANLAAGLGLDLNALRTRGVARARSQSESRQVRLDLAWSEWQTSGQARLQAVRIQALQGQLAIDAASRDAQNDLLVRTQRAAGRGDVAGDQLQTARAGAADAVVKYDATERSLTAARLELTRLLGLPPQTPLVLAAPPLSPPVPPAERLVLLALANRSDLAALRQGYDAQESGLRQAVLDQFPALNLTINVNRDTSDNVTLGPLIDFTLPLWNRNRGGIAVERATRDALKAEYAARLFQTRAEITAAVADIALLRDQRDRLLADMPAVQAFAGATGRAAERGDLSPVTAEAAAQTLRDKQGQVAQAEQDIAELTISLELLTGTPHALWPAPSLQGSSSQ